VLAQVFSLKVKDKMEKQAKRDFYDCFGGTKKAVPIAQDGFLIEVTRKSHLE